MFAMFKQLFSAIAVLFMAAERGATAINHLALWAEETAGAFSDEARIDRTAKRKALLAKSGVAEMELIDSVGSPIPVVTAPAVTDIKAKASKAA